MKEGGITYYGNLSLNAIPGAVKLVIGSTVYYLTDNATNESWVPPLQSPTSCGNYTQCPITGMSGDSTNRDCTGLASGTGHVTGCVGTAGAGIVVPIEFKTIAMCSTDTSGTGAVNGAQIREFDNPPTADPSGCAGCWCRITEFNGSPFTTARWGIVSTTRTRNNCALACAGSLQATDLFRAALFSGLGL